MDMGARRRYTLPVDNTARDHTGVILDTREHGLWTWVVCTEPYLRLTYAAQNSTPLLY